MGLISDQLRDTIAQLKELDERQQRRTDDLVKSVKQFIADTDKLTKDLEEIDLI